MMTGNYNKVILPTPGVFDEDDLVDRYFERPNGLVEREVASPVLLSEAQRKRLFLQCYSVSEFSRALMERDNDYRNELQEYEKSKGHRGRARRPEQATATEVAEAVILKLGLESPNAETLRGW